MCFSGSELFYKELDDSEVNNISFLSCFSYYNQFLFCEVGKELYFVEIMNGTSPNSRLHHLLWWQAWKSYNKMLKAYQLWAHNTISTNHDLLPRKLTWNLKKSPLSKGSRHLNPTRIFREPYRLSSRSKRNKSQTTVDGWNPAPVEAGSWFHQQYLTLPPLVGFLLPRRPDWKSKIHLPIFDALAMEKKVVNGSLEHWTKSGCLG